MESVTDGFSHPVAYTIGVDIGQVRDPTAIAVVEWREHPHTREVLHTTRYLQRLPLGASYPDIGKRLQEIITNARHKAWQMFFDRFGVTPANEIDYGFEVFIDGTGVGRPVVDILREFGLNVTPVYFTHGDRRTKEPDHITMGKAWMVSRLKVLFQTNAIMLPPNDPESVAMAQELRDYEIRVDARANDTYGAFKVGAHDDLVTALGLAVQDPDIITRLYHQRELQRMAQAMVGELS